MKAPCLLMVSRSTTRPKQPSAPPYPNPTAALRRGLQSGAAQRPFNGPSLIEKLARSLQKQQKVMNIRDVTRDVVSNELVSLDLEP